MHCLIAICFLHLLEHLATSPCPHIWNRVSLTVWLVIVMVCQHFLVLSVCCLSLLFFFPREQGLSGVKDHFLQIHSRKSHSSETVPSGQTGFHTRTPTCSTVTILEQLLPLPLRVLALYLE